MLRPATASAAVAAVETESSNRNDPSGTVAVAVAVPSATDAPSASDADGATSTSNGPVVTTEQGAPVVVGIHTATVGTDVVLSPDFASHSDAAGGPLAPGQLGTVVDVTESRLSVRRKDGSGSTWWYVFFRIRRSHSVRFIRGTGCP